MHLTVYFITVKIDEDTFENTSKFLIPESKYRYSIDPL